jgi:long-chain acyl-CoA synthetase
MYRVALKTSYFPAQTDDTIFPTTVGSVLRAAAQDSPDAIALVEALPDGSSRRRWSFQALLKESERLATALAARFAKGERIAIWAPNAPEWVIVEFAAGLAGLTLVTVNPAYQAKELRYVLEQSRSVALFLVKEFRGNPMAAIARDVCADLPFIRAIVDIEDEAALCEGADNARVLPAAAPDDPAQIQYTSGTTGFPKGAVLSHRSLTNNSRLSALRMGAGKGDTYLNVMPMFHTAGCSVAILGSVQCRCRLILLRQFDPDATIAIIERERVNLTMAVPTMLIGMLEAQARKARDFASVRAIMSGGALVPTDLVRKVESTFGCVLVIIYGQTETSPGLTQATLHDSFEDRSETIGQAYPQTEMSIRDIATNAPVPIGAIGEICSRGYCNMLGYNDNPKATADTIDREGWLHTGDLGSMDARGFLKITGRVKDMIIRGGENLFPAEIENVLVTHPDIAEVAVVGVPDARWGEIAICFFRPRDASHPAKAELVGHVRRELAAPKTPAEWIALQSFPLTGSGKIQKFVLRERYIAGEYEALRLS